MGFFRQKHHSAADVPCKTHAAPECSELDNTKQENWGKSICHLIILSFPVCIWPRLAVLTEKAAFARPVILPSIYQQHTQDTQLACHPTKHAGLVRVWPTTKFQRSGDASWHRIFLICVVLLQPRLQMTWTGQRTGQISALRELEILNSVLHKILHCVRSSSFGPSWYVSLTFYCPMSYFTRDPRVTYVPRHKYIIWVQNKFEEQKMFFMLRQLSRMFFPPNFATNFNFGSKTRTWCFSFKKKNKKVVRWLHATQRKIFTTKCPPQSISTWASSGKGS